MRWHRRAAGATVVARQPPRAGDDRDRARRKGHLAAYRASSLRLPDPPRRRAHETSRRRVARP